MPEPSPSHAADRNLLFGILALQVDFITRDQLVAAMHAWVLEKDKPLGRILHEKGALGADELALLEAMVAKHLQKHANDPAQSLQALSSVGSAREELKGITDPDVQLSLLHVSAVRPAILDPHATTPGVQPRPPVSATPADPHATTPHVAAPGDAAANRFRILRPHKEGGLGEVYVARDEELGREVALKEIKSAYAAHPDYRARFVLEAEITGGLEHPGIVPVYGLGCYGDGRPFYAMRFIRGDSLKEAIEQFHQAESAGRDPALREVALRKLLRRFYDVCNALAYAHSRGVLHRDLKPGNIMLGKYGETLVVDWGLAKALNRAETKPPAGEPLAEAPLRPSSGSGSAPTEFGQMIGTPAYMSPEQAEGRLDLLGPASDVYSLGATLYCLLTGQAPFTAKDLPVLLDNLKRGKFPRPREVKPEVPPPLEAICLKAMAPRQADRYASVAELGRDVELWLDDQPVSAWPEPWQVKARRWVKRHRLLVTGVAAAVLVAALSLAVTALLLARANERELRMREQAEANFAKARQAVDEMLTRVGDERLADVPWMEEIRKELLLEARKFYQDFLQERADDPGIREETGHAHFRVGTIQFLLGYYPEADEAHRQALEMRRQLAEAAPTAAHQQALALSHYHHGLVERERHRPEQAVRGFGQAVELQEKLAAQAPAENSYRQELAMTQSSLGHLYWAKATFEPTKAEACFRRALELRQELARQLPAVLSHRQDLAISYNSLGVVLHMKGQGMEADGAFRKALELQEQLVRDSRRPSYRQDRARTHNNRGILLQQLGDAKAEDAVRAALRDQEWLANNFPDVKAYRRDLAGAYVSLGRVLYQPEQAAAAEQAFHEALKLQEQLVKEAPDVPLYRGDVAVTHSNFGEALRVQKKIENAKQHHRQALEVLQKLVAEHAAITSFAESLARCHNNRALLASMLGAKEEAGMAYRQSQGIWSRLAHEFPRYTTYRQELARATANVGHLVRGERPAEAELFFQEALKLRRQLALDAPSFKSYQLDLAASLNDLGLVLAALKRSREAEDCYGEALGHLRAAPDSSQPAFLQAQARCHYNLGTLLAATERKKEAENAFNAAINLREELVKTNSAYRRELAATHARLGAFLEQIGRPDDAAKHKARAEALQNP